MLNHCDVLSYLLEKNWLDRSHLIQDSFQIASLSRRNWNYKVVSDQSPCYFLKQGEGDIDLGTVQHEASIYQLFQEESSSKLTRYLPHYYDYASTQKILVIEFIPNAEDLRSYQIKRGKFPKYIGAQMGAALAALHGQRGDALDSDLNMESLGFPDCTPWVFDAYQPNLNALRTISEANIKIFKMIQDQSIFRDSLHILSQSWEQKALIHGDIKFDNFIAHSSPGNKRQAQIKLLDWEFAGIGDPCWDVGSVFSDYLKMWIFSIPITGEIPPAQFGQLAEYPLEKMRGAMNSFWSTYRRQMSLDDDTADRVLLKSVQMAAARLVQTALEFTDTGRLTSTIICLLQLSLNIFKKPEQATAHLLGIPWSAS
ncbi:MAG: phosphotransferase [Cyanophyceae cyanobacterium]